MLAARIVPYTLRFRFAARTSRDTLLTRDTYYLLLSDSSRPDVTGIGECALFRGLGDDDTPDYADRLNEFCQTISLCEKLDDIPYPRETSIRFGLETAAADLRNGGKRTPFPGAWSQGKQAITINGLIWMGNAEEMARRISEKLEAGFKCLKLKIGGIDFEEELRLVRNIRDRFPEDLLELRLDANGAFNADNVMDRLTRLAPYAIHSLEQPVRPRQWELMEKVCRESPIPIALDEELIGLHDETLRRQMLAAVRPAYLILKPSLCGGFASADAWISLAEETSTGWWATSALESDIGLNAIAQWVSCHSPALPQGLGTGQLYVNNIPSPLTLRGDRLMYNPGKKWHLSAIF